MSATRSPTASVPRNGTASHVLSSAARNGTGSDSRASGRQNGTGRDSLPGRMTDLSASLSSNYSFDVQKYMKELARKREEIPAARVLPKTHLLAQLLLQEQSERDLFVLQERSLRQQLLHKRDEDRAKKEEQRLQQRSRERLDELKRRQAEELAAKKELVAAFQKQIDSEVREKLRLVCLLQPRLNVAAAVLSEIKNELCHCRLLPELMEEEKRVAKVLKADSRLGKGAADCGAVPHWIRTCVAGSFNVSAIVQDLPYRATVEDAIKVPNAALRKLVVVRHTGNDAVAAWVHVRAGSDPVAVAAELAQLPAPEELPRKSSAGVVWPKEDLADLNRRAKALAASEADLLSVVGVSSAALACEGAASFEFTKKDIENIGTIASA